MAKRRRATRQPDIDPAPETEEDPLDVAPAAADEDPLALDPASAEDPLETGDNPEGDRVVDPDKPADEPAAKDATPPKELELKELLGMDEEQKKHDPRFIELHKKGVVSYELKPQYDPTRG